MRTARESRSRRLPEMHRAGIIVVDRKTGGCRTLFIHPATVSVTGGIQPGVLLRYLTPEFAAHCSRPPSASGGQVGVADGPQ